MTSFLLPIDPKAKMTAEFFASTMERLQAVVAKACGSRGVSQASFAKDIGMNKAALSRTLHGEKNLTLRTIAEIAYGANLIPELVFVPAEEAAGVNEFDDGFALQDSPNDIVLDLIDLSFPSKNQDVSFLNEENIKIEIRKSAQRPWSSAVLVAAE